MLNDRLNNNSKSDLKDKFRDKRLVSAAAIGIFVLILLIVVIAKGCSPKKNGQKPQPAAASVAPVAPAPTPVPDYNDADNSGQNDVGVENGNDAAAQRLVLEGRTFLNDPNDRKTGYKKARECFLKAKDLGSKDADKWLEHLDKKLKQTQKPRKTQRSKSKRKRK